MKRLTNKRFLIIGVVSLTAVAFVLWLSRITPARISLPPNSTSREALDALPDTFLWAWERPEQLDFIDNDRVGVAYLAKTIRLSDNAPSVRPRGQPLILAEGTKVIAVVRIESDRRLNSPLSASHLEDTANEVVEVGKLPGVSGVQIDFDATASERSFYRHLLSRIRERLPQSMPFSMTALASWCSGDNWLTDLPVDEVVPMLFRLGVDRERFLSRMQSNEEPLQQPCDLSAGVSTDEVIRPPIRKRLYIFSPKPWTPTSVNNALETYQR